MIRLDVGETYTCSRKRSGRADSGREWELIVVKDERGSNELAVWATNIPSNVEEGHEFKLDKISSVCMKNVRNKSSNEWHVNVSVNAEVSPITVGSSYEDLGIGDSPFDATADYKPLGDIDMPDWMKGDINSKDGFLPL